MLQEKSQAIEDYLNTEFPDTEIAAVYDNLDADHYAGNDQQYLITTQQGVLMLKVSNEYLGDTPIEEIIRKFNDWSVPDLLREHYPMGVIITHNGLDTFER